MKINLNLLAKVISNSDDAKGRNIDVIAAKIVLRCLGDILRETRTNEALRVLDALAAPRLIKAAKRRRLSKDNT